MTPTLVTQDRPAKTVGGRAAPRRRWQALTTRRRRVSMLLRMPTPAGAGEGMPPPGRTARAGITLTEILFAIMVMGVGLLSVLSLFPIGLLNVARAVRLSRAGAYADGVLDDLQNRRLLAKERYRFGPAPGTFFNPNIRFNNPFIADHGLLRDGIGPEDFSDLGVGFALPGERGLPVVIDPLWIRRRVFPTPLPDQSPFLVRPGNRLGVWPPAVPFGVVPTNWGLQRVMPTDGINTEALAERLVDASDNVLPLDGVADAYPDWLNPQTLLFDLPGGFREQYLPLSLAQQIFGSRDDIAFQETEESDLTTLGDEAEQEKQWLPLYGPPLPDTVAGFRPVGEPLREQKYSSLVTAYLPDAGDPTRYEASVAVFFKRDFFPTGEQTLLAYYLPQPGPGAGNLTIPVQPSNQMILMWPANQQAPEVPREGWLLDASYDANASRWAGPPPIGPGPGRQFWPHRAFWYRIVDRGEPQTGYIDATGTFVTFNLGGAQAVRQLITLDRPVREVTPTLLAANTINYVLPPNNPNFTPLATQPMDPLASQFSVNVAVIFPGLVSVYERTLTVPKP